MRLYIKTKVFRFIVAVLCCLSFVDSSIAEELITGTDGKRNCLEGAKEPHCLVTVRTMRGFESEHGREEQEQKVPQNISDMTGQLEDLPYRHYSLLDSKQVMLCAEETGKMNMLGIDGDAHQLVVSPSGLVDGVVGIMVDWGSPSGENMVNAKLKVRNSHSVILGTESPGDACTIISVKVDCP